MTNVVTLVPRPSHTGRHYVDTVVGDHITVAELIADLEGERRNIPRPVRRLPRSQPLAPTPIRYGWTGALVTIVPPQPRYPDGTEMWRAA